MERKIGVYICECGPNIAEKIDIDKVIEAISPIEDVSVVEKYKLLCSADGKKFLEEQIRKQGLTHLVIAACSPREHEKTFMEVCENAGINPYLFQLANIREQCAWITEDKDEATKKAITLVKAAIRRVGYHVSLEKKEIECNPDVLVIGGGPYVGAPALVGIAALRTGADLAFVARPLDNRYFDRWLNRLRTRSGNRIITKQGALRGIARALKDKRFVGLLMDQGATGRDGVFVDFFGHLAGSSAALGLLAGRFQVPVHAVYAVRDRSGTGQTVYIGQCCEGLKQIPAAATYDQDCNPVGIGGAGPICSDCGNGICEPWESKCNCPLDCREPRIIYVDGRSAGANDGASWADAYNFLQDALADANSSEKPVEIRVAQGHFKEDAAHGDVDVGIGGAVGVLIVAVEPTQVSRVAAICNGV